jgi:sensor histidine kinase YesM
VVHDSGAGATSDKLQEGRAIGVGLANIERRLSCQYGPAAVLSIDSEPGVGTTVEIRIPADFRAAGLAAVRSAS